jgi:NAD(P)-dependent dehydrogenase (short-subunit alcohol dehydrogenase family)
MGNSGQFGALRGQGAKAVDPQVIVDNVMPEGRLGESIDVANAVLFLASDASSYVNGTELVIDGGLTAGR